MSNEQDKDKIKSINKDAILFVGISLLDSSVQELSLELIGIKQFYPDHLFALRKYIDAVKNNYVIEIIARDDDGNGTILGYRTYSFRQEVDLTSSSLEDLAKQKEVIVISSSIDISPDLQGFGLGSGLMSLSDGMVEKGLEELGLEKKKLIIAYIADIAKNADKKKNKVRNDRKGWSSLQGRNLGYKAGFARKYLKRSTVDLFGADKIFVKIIKDDFGISRE